MTPPNEKRKYDVTVVETVIHTFTVETDGDPFEDAEEDFVHADKLEDLPDYSVAYENREIENAIPR